MELQRYRVLNFRSITDSGWIECGRVTSLIGENESGKTNLLLPLWKLKPAREGGIEETADYPRKKYNDIRAEEPRPVFVEAEFRVPESLAARWADMTGAKPQQLASVIIARRYSGEYLADFPNDRVPEFANRTDVTAAVQEIEEVLASGRHLKGEEREIESLRGLVQQLTTGPDRLTHGELSEAIADVERALGRFTLSTSRIRPAVERVQARLHDLQRTLTRQPAAASAAVLREVVDQIPAFVYYSSYGNLDSEIYLPHVIENLKRKDLGAKEAAKARTLRVLFDFVGLKPDEVMALGKETAKPPDRPLSSHEIEMDALQKRKRDILLQSAGSKLTSEFRTWWRRGDYRFRFQADGNHFRIWVSDDKRPEDIELESRSTGLQWFLSFYLVFLVERTGAHANAILLLDEPGLSLHPLAQRDLSAFFEGLSATNQLLFTTHSPFLIDPDQLDRVKAVYSDEGGATVCSPDLRASERAKGKASSIYAVYAALGISISDVTLLGCQLVLVEGPSDQLIMSALKQVLVARGLVKPRREIVFVPTGGVKSIKPIASVLSGAVDSLPPIVLDSDGPGVLAATSLRGTLYQAHPNLVLEVQSYASVVSAEIEDLVPLDVFCAAFDRCFSVEDDALADHVAPGSPACTQAETYAARVGLQLPNPGWKVVVARAIKDRLSRAGGALSDEALAPATALFLAIANVVP